MTDRIPHPSDKPTMPLWPETGRALGIGKSSTYAAAASGDIPTIRVGRRILVPTAALRRMLGIDETVAA